MDYEEWLKIVRRDARFRESLEKSQKLQRQVTRFSNFVIADVTYQVRRGKDLNQLINELQQGFNIPQKRLKEFTGTIQDEIKRYQEFRANSGRDLGVELDDAEFQRINAILNYETNIRDQVSKDVAKVLENAERNNTIQRALASGSGASRIEGLLRQSGLKYHAITEARLALQQFNSRYTYAVAEQGGITIFEYYGPDDANNRPFCSALVGQWFTKEQLSSMVNGLGYPVLHYCGGPNCRHEALAVPPQFQNQNPDKLATQLAYIEVTGGKRPIGVWSDPAKAAAIKKSLAA